MHMNAGGTEVEAEAKGWPKGVAIGISNKQIDKATAQAAFALDYIHIHLYIYIHIYTYMHIL